MSMRPRPALLRNMLISSAVAGIPLFGVLYWLAFSQGTWGNVFIVQFVFLLFVLLGVLRFHAAFVTVSDDMIVKQGFVKLRIVDREDVASVTVLDTYRDGSHETLPQLLARGHSGDAVFRMRGFYWSREAMDAVADAIGAPTIVERPFTLTSSTSWLRNGVLVRGWIDRVHRRRVHPLGGLISWLMTALGLPNHLRNLMRRAPLRPFAHLFRQGVLATVAFMLPILLVLYFLTIPDGPWQAVLATSAGHRRRRAR